MALGVHKAFDISMSGAERAFRISPPVPGCNWKPDTSTGAMFPTDPPVERLAGHRASLHAPAAAAKGWR